ncbi:MAG: hypothetical protein SOX92_03275 [Candidatus Onthovivens sp.]|jgi:hypothetical protein|nr:hypothetical protein [Candidatus Onthovivens sp.]
MSKTANNTKTLENNLNETISASGENADAMEDLSQQYQEVGRTAV